MHRYVFLLFAGLLCTVSVQAFEASVPEDGVEAGEAVETIEASPRACEAEGYHRFDFWLGEWEVTDPSGVFQGNNKVSLQEKGCLILEEWTSAGGSTGQSYNYYNPATDLWRQVWVSGGAIIDYSGGLTETGSMKLEGDITYQVNANTARFTGEWTLNEDGSVTQHFEQYDPEEDVWSVWFTGIYRRQVEDLPDTQDIDKP